MPQLETSTLIWIGCLTSGTVLWMIFVAPRLVPMLEMNIHQTADDEPRRITIIDKITLYMSSMLMFVVFIIMMIMFYEVVMRYLFRAPTLWVEELSRWLGGVIFLLAGLYAMQQRAHIRVVILYDIVSRPVQRVLDLVATGCIVFFCYAAATGYAKNAMTKISTWELYGSAWNPPIPATMKPLIVIACTWMAVQTINNLIVDWSRPKELHDPTEDI
jgi:TRAP-type mannitol/chloroaromatic compound transport system permease small subunit